MEEITIESFENTIDYLVNASQKSNTKGNKMKEWFMSNFQIEAGVSHTTDNRAITNRISEQFRYNPSVVVFVCSSDLNIQTLVKNIQNSAYEKLECVLILSNTKPYKYINLFVNNPTKAEALTELLPTSKDYNGHVVKINVIPANDFEVSPATLFQQALEGNPIFNDVFVVQGMYNNPVTYVIFEDQVAQYWNDNLGDPHGNVSTLYQELAQKIFDVEGINYCTKEIEK